MDLRQGYCLICKLKSNSIPCNDASFWRQLILETFGVHKDMILKARCLEFNLCISCAYKVRLAWQLKKCPTDALISGEETKQDVCLFCGKLNKYSVNIDDNPSKLRENYRAFCKACNLPINKENQVCFQCAYSLQIWIATYETLSKLRTIVFNGIRPKVGSRNRFGRVIHDVIRKSKLKSVAALKRINFERSIKKDEKMYRCIPYVNVTSSINKFLKNQECSDYETIDIDSDMEIDDKAIQKQIEDIINNDLDRSQPGSERVAAKQLPKQFTVEFTRKFKYILNSDIEAVYMCDICDQHFPQLFELKAHLLWHENPRELIVKVKRTCTEQARRKVMRRQSFPSYCSTPKSYTKRSLSLDHDCSEEIMSIAIKYFPEDGMSVKNDEHKEPENDEHQEPENDEHQEPEVSYEDNADTHTENSQDKYTTTELDISLISISTISHDDESDCLETSFEANPTTDVDSLRMFKNDSTIEIVTEDIEKTEEGATANGWYGKPENNLQEEEIVVPSQNSVNQSSIEHPVLKSPGLSQ